MWQVLNAMLLGCAGETGPTAVQALNAALAGGAVPDTWAPNGSSVRCPPASPADAPQQTVSVAPKTLRIHIGCQTLCCAEALTTMFGERSDLDP
jgi:hypothetical protein